MRDIFIKRLSQLAETNPKIFLVTGDLGFRVLDDYAKRFPKQFLNAGVAEQNMTGLAVGLALEGRIVFTYSIANFPTLRCLEQLRNDACFHEANVKVVSIGGGFSYGALGASHHATEDLSILRALPGIKVFVPGDDWEVDELTKAAVDTPGTCYLRLDKSSAGHTRKNGELFQVGKARTVREGSDVTLVTSGGILAEVLASADHLLKKGISCRVLSMHTVAPIDRSAIRNACLETGGVISIEEHTLNGGLGGAIAEVCMDEGIYPSFSRRIGLRGEFSSMVGSQKYLREFFGIDRFSIIRVVTDALSS